MTLEEILFNLGECLCSALADLPSPPAECCVVADAPIIVSCCQGFAWVRLLTAFPSDDGVSPTYARQRCRPPMWAAMVELGVARCAPETCGQLENTCCEQEADAVLQRISDFNAMQRALHCCLPAIAGAPKLDQIVLGPWVASDPEGNCGESKMTATIQYINSCSC